LELDERRSSQLKAAFQRIANVSIPFARKKDAHPENWLVSKAGKVIMIDLEAQRSQPCLLDVVQLLDDYPVFPPDSMGWQKRMRACGQYWESLFETAPPVALIEKAYAALAILRCAFGLSYCAREAGRRAASSALRSLTLRRNHFDDLLHFLETEGCSEDVKLASAILRRA